MLQQKVKALALMALGLTGLLLGLTAALVASVNPEQADLKLLVEFYLIGTFFGFPFIIWGGKKWDATAKVVKQETAQLATV